MPVGSYPPTLSETLSGSFPLSVQRGAPSPAPSSPSQRSAPERAVSTTVRPGIESEPTALLSSLSESEVHNDSCMDTLSFTLPVLPLANLLTLLLEGQIHEVAELLKKSGLETNSMEIGWILLIVHVFTPARRIRRLQALCC